MNGSPELRWWLFSNFGASKICPEMQKRGVPLKLPLLGPQSIGRFYPTECRVTVDELRKTIAMNAGGAGYAVLPVTRRVGFYAQISVEYAPDFRMESDAMYVWGKYQRQLAAPQLRILGVENAMVNLATKTPAGDVATALGQAIMTNEIGKGFTVVRQDDGDDFTLGHLEPPEKPKRQFKAGDDHVVLASDLTELHAQTREFLGPFDVPPKSALFMKARTSGSPLAYAVVARPVGDPWLQGYVMGQPLGAPPGPVSSGGTLTLGESTLRAAVPAGSYYIMVENQSRALLAPIGVTVPLAEPSASLGYSVELGDP